MRRFPWWLVGGALLLAGIFLPTLASDFDFVEDSLIVYSTSRSPVEVVARVATITWSEYQVTGPFRPITWGHWEAAASLLGPDPFGRRVARLLCALAAGAMLALLRELGASRGAALLAGMFALWNPFRGEIWIRLGMPEAYAMPYALFALVCAARAARSDRPLAWDVAGVGLLLLCLGIKNVFISLIPALVWLRLAGAPGPWHGRAWRAAWYAALALLPIAHFVLLKMDPRPTHFQTRLSLAHVVHMTRAMATACTFHTLLPSFVLLAAALRYANPTRHAVALVAAGLLFVAGFGVYLPIVGMYPRYTMPAVWGVDIAFALALTALAAAPPVLRRLTTLALVFTLLIVGWRCLARQDDAIARGRMHWEAVLFLESVGDGERVAFVHPEEGTTHEDISVGECFHLANHLRRRGRTTAELAPGTSVEDATLVLAGDRFRPGPGYSLVREFQARRAFAGDVYRSRLWRRDG